MRVFRQCRAARACEHNGQPSLALECQHRQPVAGIFIIHRQARRICRSCHVKVTDHWLCGVNDKLSNITTVAHCIGGHNGVRAICGCSGVARRNTCKESTKGLCRATRHRIQKRDGVFASCVTDGVLRVLGQQGAVSTLERDHQSRLARELQHRVAVLGAQIIRTGICSSCDVQRPRNRRRSILITRYQSSGQQRGGPWQPAHAFITNQKTATCRTHLYICTARVDVLASIIRHRDTAAIRVFQNQNSFFCAN